MKRLAFLLVIIALAFSYSNLLAQTEDPPKPPKEHGKHFVDKNGDGYNDNAPDHDGDGIPNGLDPDFLAIKNKNAQGRFVDLDGDGIKDNPGKGKKGKNSKGGFGPGDGTGNKMGPQNRADYGQGDGTQTAKGPMGKGKKWGRK